MSTCLESGEWDVPFVACVFRDVECDEPDEASGWKCPDLLLPGATCDLVCDGPNEAAPETGTVAVCRSGRGQVSPAGQFLLLPQLLQQQL